MKKAFVIAGLITLSGLLLSSCSSNRIDCPAYGKYQPAKKEVSS